jgi:DNA-binding GntR family transcriptional regulator
LPTVKFTGRPAYLIIADDLRQQILNGDLPSGTQLPSETELMSSYGVSRMVAKMATRTLRDEGLIDTHPGKGKFVRPSRQLTRLARNRYARTHERTPPFAFDASAAGAAATWEHQSERGQASTAIAQRLRIRPGNPVMITHYRFLADRHPVQLSVSYEPLAITRNTPIELPEAGPIYGVIQRMDTIGYHVTEVTEEITSRAPHPHERDLLGIPSGVHVLLIARTHWSGETPVETCDIVIPADRYALVYRIAVDSQPQDASPQAQAPSQRPPA